MACNAGKGNVWADTPPFKTRSVYAPLCNNKLPPIFRREGGLPHANDGKRNNRLVDGGKRLAGDLIPWRRYARWRK